MIDYEWWARLTAHKARSARGVANRDRLVERYRRYAAQCPRKVHSQMKREFGF